jgi:hypothetical protein
MKAKLKIQTKWIKDEQAKHKREMHNPQSTDSERAAAYALWLAQRDGRPLPVDPARFTVRWERVGRVKRARAVQFSNMLVPLPHWDYVERGAVQLPDAPEGAV